MLCVCFCFCSICVSSIVICVCSIFLSVFVVCCCCLCFRLVYSSFCIYNRTNTYNNRTKHIKSFEKNNKTENNINTLFPSRSLRDIYSRSGRGLDILYFCCFPFFSKLFCFISVYLCCCFCFHLVCLSVCIYKRNNSYKNRKPTKRFEKNIKQTKRTVCLISVCPCLFLVNSSKSYHICFTQVTTLTTTKHI